jgi:hypothetical protein
MTDAQLSEMIQSHYELLEAVENDPLYFDKKRLMIEEMEEDYTY